MFKKKIIVILRNSAYKYWYSIIKTERVLLIKNQEGMTKLHTQAEFWLVVIVYSLWKSLSISVNNTFNKNRYKL